MEGPNKLWRYHLHYHDHLADAAWVSSRLGDAELAERVAADLRAWMLFASEGGSPAWDPYPTSVRLLNWLRIVGWAPRISEMLGTTLTDEIGRHVEFIGRAFEWHLEGNHVLRNACAWLAGTIVTDTECGSGRRHEAKRTFESLLGEQILDDGVHEERTPLYHARALRDAVDVEAMLDAIGEPLSPPTRLRIHRMRIALAGMLRSDGSLWQLNDTLAQHEVDLQRLVSDVRAPQVWHAPRAAITTIRAFGRIGVRFDHGAPGPAHQPGHAHAGALGFEMDVDGCPLLIDSGVSGYDGDPMRYYFRSTAAHNVVRIHETDQSELWATFRLARRASVVHSPPRVEADAVTIEGACVPYFNRRIRHVRALRVEPKRLIVEDLVEGPARGAVEAFFHFGPTWECTRISGNSVRAHNGHVLVTVSSSGPASLELHRGSTSPVLGWVATGLGTACPTSTLRLRSDSYDGRPWITSISVG